MHSVLPITFQSIIPDMLHKKLQHIHLHKMIKLFDHVMRKSSTYRHKMTWFCIFEPLTYTPCSYMHLVNHELVRKLSILLFQVLGACFIPYKTFLNRYTFLSWPLISKPSGCLTYTSSSNGSFKQADFTWSWCIFWHLYVVIATTILIVLILATRAYT